MGALVLDHRGRSNSFNYAPVKDVARRSGAACPVKAGAAELGAVDPRRELFLRLRDRMRLFRTGTTDFSDEEVAAVKGELGQIYADVSGKIAPDDFARDMRKLALDTECEGCERYGSCPGCFHALASDVFSRDDARVRAILGGLAGDVLDIGCGEGPYLDVLRERALAGQIRYLGVDPDAGRVALLASRHPWARYLVGGVETLPRLLGGGACFNHVLVLRSYNHLPDPERAVELAVSLLRPEGTLLIVDNVAFGLVRSGDHVARAEAGPAVFEHFRNDSSHEAAARIAPGALALIERADVSPSSSNQWLLHYQRVTEAPS